MAIQVRNNPVPLLSAIMKSSASGSREASHSGISGNISSFEHKKQPPQPPPKTSTLTSKHGDLLKGIDNKEGQGNFNLFICIRVSNGTGRCNFSG